MDSSDIAFIILVIVGVGVVAALLTSLHFRIGKNKYSEYDKALESFRPSRPPFPHIRTTMTVPPSNRPPQSSAQKPEVVERVTPKSRLIRED
jgi:hypothetical protein